MTATCLPKLQRRQMFCCIRLKHGIETESKESVEKAAEV